jgi:hypothetical protein
MTEEQRDELMQKLVDRVEEEIKSDIYEGDTTVLDELLHLVPVQYLIGYLPDEEEWAEFLELNKKDLNKEKDYVGFGVDDVYYRIEEEYSHLNPTDEHCKAILAICSNNVDFSQGLGWDDLDSAIESFYGI